jgi:adenylate cyclase
MPSEIERKFIVPLAHHHLFLGREGGTEVVQAYLSTNPDFTVRLRIAKTGNLELAKMTIKGRPTDGGMVRSEWEWPVPVRDAREIIAHLNPPSLHKTRHVVQHGDDTWEVDVLRVNEVAGRAPGMWSHLVVAEYEAPTLAQVQSVTLPPWVGRDVTGDATFIMSTLTTEAMRDLAWRKAYL